MPRPARPRLYRDLAIALVMVAAGGLLLGLLYFQVVNLLFLLFAGMLVAILLQSIASAIARRLETRYGIGLAVTVTGLAAIAALGVWLVAPQLAEQFGQLADRLPPAFAQFRQQLERWTWSRYLLRQVPAADELLASGSGFLSQATGLVTGAIDVIVYGVVILFTGLYLAAEPRSYVDGLVRLAPPQRRQRFREIIRTLVYTLRWWMAGQAVTMTVIGTLTSLGLWLLGVPLWLPLGVLAGLLNFIPNFGPLIALAPSALMALTIGPAEAGYVILLYLAIQSFEGYVLTPLIQRRAVLLPPALTLATQVLMGWLVGGLGVMVAAPLAAALLVAVKMIYVEDILEDRMHVPGESRAKRQAAEDQPPEPPPEPPATGAGDVPPHTPPHV